MHKNKKQKLSSCWWEVSKRILYRITAVSITAVSITEAYYVFIIFKIIVWGTLFITYSVHLFYISNKIYANNKFKSLFVLVIDVTVFMFINISCKEFRNYRFFNFTFTFLLFMQQTMKYYL